MGKQFKKQPRHKNAARKKHGKTKGIKKHHSANVTSHGGKRFNKAWSHRKELDTASKLSQIAANAPTTQDRCSKEDLSDDDMEPDPFSQLVSCFKDSSKKQYIVSDDDSESEDEEKGKLVESSASLGHDLEDNGDGESIDGDGESIDGDGESIDGDGESIDVDGDGEFDGDDAFNNSDSDEANEELNKVSADPFENHIQYDLNDDLLEAVSSEPQKTEEIIKSWPVLGTIKFTLPRPISKPLITKPIRIGDDTVFAKPGQIPQKIEKISSDSWASLHVKSQIQTNILNANLKLTEISLNSEDQLTPLQKELFSILNNYQDLHYSQRTLDNGGEVMFVYCLHVINHVLKTRLKVIHHNARLANKLESKEDVPDEFRDQGLIRPKVLILVPFRSSVVKVVELLSTILLGDGKINVINKKRFYDEFTSGELIMPRKNPKPQDYERLFTGDTDDNFKIGISITKKSLKLYVDFYSADVIVASPLGLRVLVGAPGQKDRDYDFLSSIELLILDQADVILMQNWDHLLHLWDHLHLQPTQSHGTNFARVRLWALNGRARFYRQTVLLSSVSLPQISSLFSRKCHNYAGKASVVNSVTTGAICQIVMQLPHMFNRIDCSSAAESIDARFNYFVKKVLPQFKEPLMNHTLIYVPSYFDYVRIRNYFNKETVSFKQICEYTKEAKVSRARNMFFHGYNHFLLYSERFHFFRRIRIKGIRHIIFYQPPTFPHFYSELCNLMESTKQSEESSLSVSVLYTRYDAPQLAAIVSSERAARMLAAQRPTHMFMTSE